MNEEQRAVLAAVARLEESRGGPVDEYTVARAAGILTSDLSGQFYVRSPERERIHRLFDELEDLGLIRLERTGYWRPRTALAGRRALQAPPDPPTRRSFRPPGRSAVPIDLGATQPAPRVADGEETHHWPAWWPAALRVGDPALTPILAPVGIIAALLLVVLVGARTLSRGTPLTPTVAMSASPAARITATLTATGAAPGSVGSPAGATPIVRTTVPRPTATLAPLVPTLVVANTDNQGAYLYATPAGEKRFAVSEGTELEDIGPDEQDSQGRVWKHVRYGNFTGWILQQYTAPVGP